MQKNKLIVSSILFVLFSSFYSTAQDSSDFDVFKNYSSWSFSLQPAFYKKAKTEPYYGTHDMNNKNGIGWSFGANYSFCLNKKWSFITGAYIYREPVYWAKVEIEETDKFSDGDPESTGSIWFTTYGPYTLSVPFWVEYKHKINEKLFLNISPGWRVFLLPYGGAELSISVGNEDGNGERQVFASYADSQSNTIQGSFLLNTGVYIPYKKVLLKLNLVYNKSFQTLFTGEYQFGNLLISDPTKGSYKMSGDFIGVNVSIAFKKRG